MRHSATSRHRGGQWQYWGNGGKCQQPHANDKGNGKGCQKKWWGCWRRYQTILKGIGKVIEDVKK
jgi:hypothetical protein